MLSLILFFILSYYWHGLGVTIGYHRLLSHRALNCPKFVEYFWLISGYLAFEGSPAWWATVHRVHHRNADKVNDPHSPKDGAGHAYFNWMFDQNLELIDVAKVSPDLMKDTFYRFLEKGDDPLMLVINFAFRAVIWYFFGWQMALVSLLAGLLVLQIPLTLNLVCHIPRFGYRNYHTNNDAVNVWWVALFSAGEGWHNNHHAHPASAKTGEKWFEFDLSWQVIRLMNALGLVSHYNLPGKPLIAKPPLTLVRNNTSRLVATARKRN
jgi:stearoyl-CoA desaturase (delta-9 desaturase)